MQNAMSSIIFKRLFEVQILHDYYLTSADGISFFEKNKEDKNKTIIKKLRSNLYDVRDVFNIQPVGSTQLKMSEYKLLVANTSLGFIVGTEVSVENQAGETVYKPRQEFKDDLNLSFSVRPRLSFFKSMTNISLRPQLPALHYFTNKDREELDESMVPNYKSLPISNKATNHQNGMIHEMGAIIDFAGTVREAIQRTDGTDATHWEDINDKRFVTNADQILLPHNFNYSLKKEDGILQVEFVLEDASSTVIKTITKTSAVAIENVRLNFTKVDETDEASANITNGHYTLKIKVGPGPEITYPVYLNDAIYDKDALGVIEIRADEPNSPLSLLDAAGFLKTRINVANEKVPHPVFEVRFKNRRTYWRYNQEEDFTPAEVAATAAHLQHQPKMLISLKPKAVTETLVPFINGVSLMLPHPRLPSIKVDGEKIFSEIYINQSNRLLNS